MEFLAPELLQPTKKRKPFDPTKTKSPKKEKTESVKETPTGKTRKADAAKAPLKKVDKVKKPVIVKVTDKWLEDYSEKLISKMKRDIYSEHGRITEETRRPPKSIKVTGVLN